MATPFRREIKWEPGFDYLNDPEKKQYGRHGLQIRWFLHGPKGTIQFLLFTDWLPTWKDVGEGGPLQGHMGPLPADIGYHADEPQYEGQEFGECDCRPSKRCCYDGSGLQANAVFKLLVTKGEDAVWQALEDQYAYQFGQPEGRPLREIQL